MNFREKLQSRTLLVLDGGMGVLLQKAGLPLGGHPEAFNITHPQVVEGIHRGYLLAGAQAVYTNTFGASAKKLAGSGYTVEQVVDAAVQVARRAATPFDAWVGLDIGPLGELLEPMGPLAFEEAYELFAQQVRQGVKSGVNFIVIETMTDLYEMKAAILAAKEHSDLPILATMSFEENGRTFTGCDLRSMAITLEGLGVDALGINCSLGPTEIYPLAQALMPWTSLPVMIKPNAGIPTVVHGETIFTITHEDFAEEMARFLPLGVSIIGGCCGTDPDYIQRLVDLCKTVPIGERSPLPPPAAICSASKTVELSRVRVIGERINPTGKKKLGEALREKNLSYILSQGISQGEVGADILDVNVGLPDINQVETMVWAVKGLQGILDLPLQLDSSETEVLEAALRVYNGKPIVNSVNAELEVLQRILPLVKKYGAAVVGLTLDENGIPDKAEDRFALAKRILEAARSYGIPDRDVYIDCLTLTVSAQQEGARETLKALSLIREGLGLHTVLGVSNISFGLPARETMNLTFLTQAMAMGLTLPILNPGNLAMMDAIAAHNALTGADSGCAEYVQRFAARMGEPAPQKTPAPAAQGIGYFITRGLQEESRLVCKELLEYEEPLTVVNDHLIPVLDYVGAQYEAGHIFLPQLISSAEAAKGAFEVIKASIAAKGGKGHEGEKILLATVKGDIHDIGKNIVKVVLENYGYRVVDLGKDVPVQTVVETAVKENIALVGLSALMTTTVKSMAQTIEALRESGHPCTIFVGGAVLTADYAAQIGADWYAKDAQAAVAIARNQFVEK